MNSPDPSKGQNSGKHRQPKVPQDLPDLGQSELSDTEGVMRRERVRRLGGRTELPLSIPQEKILRTILESFKRSKGWYSMSRRESAKLADARPHSYSLLEMELTVENLLHHEDFARGAPFPTVKALTVFPEFDSPRTRRQLELLGKRENSFWLGLNPTARKVMLAFVAVEKRISFPIFRELTSGGFEVKPSTFSNTLNALESFGLVKKVRKQYQLTPKARTFLSAYLSCSGDVSLTLSQLKNIGQKLDESSKPLVLPVSQQRILSSSQNAALQYVVEDFIQSGAKNVITQSDLGRKFKYTTQRAQQVTAKLVDSGHVRFYGKEYGGLGIVPTERGLRLHQVGGGDVPKLESMCYLSEQPAELLMLRNPFARRLLSLLERAVKHDRHAEIDLPKFRKLTDSTSVELKRVLGYLDELNLVSINERSSGELAYKITEEGRRVTRQYPEPVERFPWQSLALPLRAVLFNLNRLGSVEGVALRELQQSVPHSDSGLDLILETLVSKGLIIHDKSDKQVYLTTEGREISSNRGPVPVYRDDSSPLDSVRAWLKDKPKLFSVLRVLADQIESDDQGIHLDEVTERLGLSKSSVFFCLKRLSNRGLLEVPGKGGKAGYTPTSLGRAVLRGGQGSRQVHVNKYHHLKWLGEDENAADALRVLVSEHLNGKHVTGHEVSAGLDCSAATIQLKLRLLQDAGLVERAGRMYIPTRRGMEWALRQE